MKYRYLFILLVCAVVAVAQNRVGGGRITGPTSGAGIDTTAIHNNVDGEIYALPSIATPATTDVVMLEDASDSYSKGKATIGHTIATLGIDKVTAGQLFALPAIATPSSLDVIAAEDESNSYSKGRIALGTIVLDQFAATTSVQLASIISDETGTGALALASSPALVTPSVGNGSTSAGSVLFYEDSDNGSNAVTLIGPASTADVTLTLPAVTGTLGTVQGISQTYDLRPSLEGATAGDARGDFTVDLQMQRSDSSMVAAGKWSAIIGGFDNKIVTNAFGNFITGAENSITDTCRFSGIGGYQNTITSASPFGYNFIWGYGCSIACGSATVFGTNNEATAGGASSMVFGNGASASQGYHMTQACRPFATAGDAQYNRAVLKVSTTDATPTVLLNYNVVLSIPDDTVYTFKAFVTGMEQSSSAADNTTRDSAGYTINGVVENYGGDTDLVGTPTIVAFEDDSAWDCAVTATDSTTDSLTFTVTGAAATNIRWFATVEYNSITYP